MFSTTPGPLLPPCPPPSTLLARASPAFFSPVPFFYWHSTMLLEMAASAVIRCSATRSTTVKIVLNSNVLSTHPPLPKDLPHVEHTRALAIIQPRACMLAYAVVELADTVEHSRWHAKAS